MWLNVFCKAPYKQLKHWSQRLLSSSHIPKDSEKTCWQPSIQESAKGNIWLYSSNYSTYFYQSNLDFVVNVCHPFIFYDCNIWRLKCTFHPFWRNEVRVDGAGKHKPNISENKDCQWSEVCYLVEWSSVYIQYFLIIGFTNPCKAVL